MKTRTLIEYLKRFNSECDVRMIVINPKRRIKYDVGDVVMIIDAGVPVFGIELDGEHDFDDEEKKTAEECEAEAIKN